MKRIYMDGSKIATMGRAVVLFAVLAAPTSAQKPSPLGWDPYLTFAGNFDVAYRNTQFFTPNHNVFVGQWDSRAELWLWPRGGRKKFSVGAYVRATGVAASKPEAWENAWLGAPGVGLQVYPFSLPALRNSSSKVAQVFGPLRLFGEYNWVNYRKDNEGGWRPDRQTRIGAEHWLSLNVNDLTSPWWAETWNGLWWQSTNEFEPPKYRSTIFANAVRAGLRRSRNGAVAAVTPYVALESSLTRNKSYYWENRLLAGGGFRITPPIRGAFQANTRINRFAIYAEYLRVATYYRQAAPSSVPNHEVRIGVTFSTGLWYYGTAPPVRTDTSFKQ